MRSDDDKRARWLIMTGKEWHWFPEADNFEPLTPTGIKDDGPYPVSIDMNGTPGSESVQHFLRDAWLNGSHALVMLANRDAEHAAEFARRTVPAVDVLRSISCWPLEKPCHCGQEMCRRARAALSLLLGETP